MVKMTPRRSQIVLTSKTAKARFIRRLSLLKQRVCQIPDIGKDIFLHPSSTLIIPFILRLDIASSFFLLLLLLLLFQYLFCYN